VNHPALFFAGLVAGGMNSIAGGGSLVTFTVMQLLGIPATLANTTSTVALVPGAVGSFVAYRKHVSARDPVLWLLAVVGLVGGAAGAALLLGVSEHTFERMVPWLLLGATALFAIQGPLMAFVRRKKPAQAIDRRTVAAWLLLGVFQLFVSIYGGFFGAGIGILMLSALGLAGISDLSRANGLKQVGAFVINAIAAVGFISTNHVEWRAWPALCAGAITGGLGGALIARKAPQTWVRRAIVLVGLGVSAASFWRLYRP
jgi:uncharacterized membrane protein YfcA